RTVAAHPRAVLAHGRVERARAGRARRAHGREDAAARGMELLVRRTASSQRELVDAVAREARVRVTVDEARYRDERTAVELLDIAVERPEVAHPPDCGDAPLLAEHVRIADDVHASERVASQRRTAAGRTRDLREIADQEATRRRRPLGTA